MFSFISLGMVSSAWAWGKPRAKRVDRNQDGIVDKKEHEMEQALKKMNQAKVDQPWEAKLDKNKNGVVEPKEVKKASLFGRVKVNCPLEQKYDANEDGWLGPLEQRQLLQDKCEIIKTRGNAVVDSELEKKYDTNGDWSIDAQEAEALKADLRKL